jgi:hypothetical protein
MIIVIRDFQTIQNLNSLFSFSVLGSKSQTTFPAGYFNTGCSDPSKPLEFSL